jgi:glycerol kinase
MGDSHAALFAHQGWKDGSFKATFGTGTSLMGLTKINPQTIAWQIDGEITQAVEANILSTGSTLVWLAELLGTTPDELAKLAPESTQVVELVPAFNGLGAPWWDREATGIITGLTRGSSRADLAAAALRSTAAQINDVLEDFAKSDIKIETLHADGGGARNQFLMQMLADPTLDPLIQSELSEVELLALSDRNETAAAKQSLDAILYHWQKRRNHQQRQFCFNQFGSRERKIN